MKNLAPKVTDILNSDLDVLVYSGDKDFICNWRGGEAWTLGTEWPHQADFANTTYVDWKMEDGTVAGELREFKNFKFLRVHDAGHMVPMN